MVSVLHSAANSSGSLLNTSRRKPLIIMPGEVGGEKSGNRNKGGKYISALLQTPAAAR